VRSGHNASTLKPYDPSEIGGDLSPSATAKSLAARPPRRNHCGMFGQILLVAVAVAVTALVAGPAAGLRRLWRKSRLDRVRGRAKSHAVAQGH
jgi:hypothetical protein